MLESGTCSDSFQQQNTVPFSQPALLATIHQIEHKNKNTALSIG